LIESPYQIIWTRGDKKQFLNNVSIPEGSVVLDKYKETERVNYKEWAERAGMTFDYAVIYHLFCSDTHHTMSAMNRDAFEEDDKFAGFTIAPNYDDLDYIITLAMHYMLIAIEITTRYLRIDLEWVAPLQKKLDELGLVIHV